MSLVKLLKTFDIKCQKHNLMNYSSHQSHQDLENESNLPLEQVNIDTILELQRAQQMEREAEQERKKKAMAERGLHIDTAIDDF